MRDERDGTDGRRLSDAPSAAREVAAKVKSAVIPRSEVTRNPSFCGHLNQEGSLAALGMTAFFSFFRGLLKRRPFALLRANRDALRYAQDKPAVRCDYQPIWSIRLRMIAL